MSTPAQQPIYRAVIETAVTDDYIEFNKFTSLKYSYYLNRGSVAELTCPLNYEKVTVISKSTRQVWLRVYRRDTANDSEYLVWYGKLYECSYSGDENAATLVMKFENVVNLLANRYVPSDYSVTTATDQSDILWALINNTQLLTGGNLGITRGAAPVSKNRTAVTELQNRTIKDVMESYSEVIDGVDWEITPTPKNPAIHIFNTYFTTTGAKYHKGDTVTTPITYIVDNAGASSLNNASSFSITEQGKDFANSIKVLGATVDEATVTSTAQDAASITAYGLFEKVSQESTLEEQSTVDDRADELLSALSIVPLAINFKLIPHVQPRVGTYDVGDIFSVRFQYYDAVIFETDYRVYGIAITVDENGVENVSLDLNVV